MLKPLGDRVLVKVAEEKEMKVGSIVLANNAKEKPQSGEVIEIGEGALTDSGSRLPMSVKKGDQVLFDKYAGSEVTFEDTKYLVLHDKDIMGIIE